MLGSNPIKALLQRSIFILAAALAVAFPCRAQQGVIQIQTNTQTLFNGTITCPFTQTFNIQNINQSVHVVTYSTPTSSQTVKIFIEGSNDGITFFQLSDTAMTNPLVGVGALIGFGFYPIVRANVAITGCTGSPAFSLVYNAAGVTPGFELGAFDATAIAKTLSRGADASTGHVFTFTAPYANTAGVITFEFSGTAPTGGGFEVDNCDPTFGGAFDQVFAIPAANGVQFSFPVRAFPTPCVSVTYNQGAGGSGGLQLFYNFTKPGGAGGAVPALNTQSTHIVGATTVQIVKHAAGVLHGLAVNTPAAGTIAIYDVPQDGCTGTPSNTLLKANITLTGSSQPETILYDMGMNGGICVLPSSATMDLTVLFN